MRRGEAGLEGGGAVDGEVVVLARIDRVPLIQAGDVELELAEIMLDLELGVDLVGEIARLVCGVDLPRILRVDRIGIAIGTVEAARIQRDEGVGEPIARGRRAERGGRDGQQLLRGEDAGQRRVGVGHAGLAVGRQRAGQAAEDARRVALALLLLVAQAVVLLVEIVTHQVDGRVRLGAPAQRGAGGVLVATVDPGVVVEVLGIAVAVEIAAGQPDAERVGQGHVDKALDAIVVVIAVFTLDAGMQTLEVGLGGDEVDDARGRVATEQRALRAAQDFDALEVEVIGLEDAGVEQRQVVDVDRGRRIAGHADAQVADAADGEDTAGEVALGERDVGQGQLKIGRIVDLLRGEGLRGEGGDRDRHVLEALRRALGGDDDFIERIIPAGPGFGGRRRLTGVGRGALRVHRHGGEQGEQRSSGQSGPRGSGQAHDFLPRKAQRRRCIADRVRRCHMNRSGPLCPRIARGEDRPECRLIADRGRYATPGAADQRTRAMAPIGHEPPAREMTASRPAHSCPAMARR